MILPRYIMDSTVWVDYYLGDALVYDLVISRLRKKEIIVPTICAYEVALAIDRRISEEHVKVVVANMREQQIDDLTFDRAVAASFFRYEHKLAMADAIVYASTTFHNAVLITHDKDFEGLPNVHLLVNRKS